jgi:glutamine synthetase type III
MPNIVLNTIVADCLMSFADELESSSDFLADVAALTKKTLSEHSRIIFNGNNYAEEWVAEAEKRGLLNLKSTPEVLPICRRKRTSSFSSDAAYSRKRKSIPEKKFAPRTISRSCRSKRLRSATW